MNTIIVKTNNTLMNTFGDVMQFYCKFRVLQCDLQLIIFYYLIWQSGFRRRSIRHKSPVNVNKSGYKKAVLHYYLFACFVYWPATKSTEKDIEKLPAANFELMSCMEKQEHQINIYVQQLESRMQTAIAERCDEIERKLITLLKCKGNSAECDNAVIDAARIFQWKMLYCNDVSVGSRPWCGNHCLKITQHNTWRNLFAS